MQGIGRLSDSLTLDSILVVPQPPPLSPCLALQTPNQFSWISGYMWPLGKEGTATLSPDSTGISFSGSSADEYAVTSLGADCKSFVFVPSGPFSIAPNYSGTMNEGYMDMNIYVKEMMEIGMDTFYILARLYGTGQVLIFADTITGRTFDSRCCPMRVAVYYAGSFRSFSSRLDISITEV